MRIGNRDFSPALWPGIATLLVIPLLVSLGFWQLDRAEQKRALHLSYMQRQTDEAIDLNAEVTLRNNEQEILWRKVKATGTFDETVQVLLDNQVVNNEAGYFIYTPFRLTGDNNWYLVNRGWVAAGNDRNRVPDLIRTQGEVYITGIAKKVQETGISLKKNIAEQLSPGIYRLHTIDMIETADLIGRTLMPYVIRLDADSRHGYVRNWQQPGSGETMHLGYAFQWFVLAILVFIIFIVVNLKKIGTGDQQ